MRTLDDLPVLSGPVLRATWAITLAWPVCPHVIPIIFCAGDLAAVQPAVKPIGRVRGYVETTRHVLVVNRRGDVFARRVVARVF